MCSSNIVYYKKQQQKDTEEFIAGNHALKEADSEENFDAQYLSTQISSTWWLHDQAEQSSLFSSKLTYRKERDQHHAQRKENKNKAISQSREVEEGLKKLSTLF